MAAASSTSGGSMRQRASAAASSHRTGRRASPIGHAETVAMVRIMDSLDYDGDRGTYRNPNAHKKRIIAQVRSELMEKFSCDRTVNQLQKKWSDLKRQEKDWLREIREQIMKQGRRQRRRGRSRTTRRSSPVSPPPPPPPEPTQVSGTTNNPLQPVMESALVALDIPELLRPLLSLDPQQQATEEEKDDEDSESDKAVPLDLSGS